MSSAISLTFKQALASGVLLAAACAAPSALAGNPAIVVDGSSGEWSRVLTLANQGTQAQSASTMKALVAGGKLNILIEGQQLDTKYNLYLNKDGLPATGAWSSSNAEFLLTGDTGFNNLHSSTGAGWSWSAPIANSGVQVAANRYAIEIAIPLATLGVTGTVPKLRIGFQSLSPTWAATAQLPVNGSYAELTTPFAIGKGLIIPAYFSITAPYTPPGAQPVPDPWNILKEGAIQVRNSSNPNYKDFFVVVNSGSNGPFTASADWATAATRWDPIRANGGRVFGYVHTCVSVEQPDHTFLTGPAFRSLDTMKAEITAWVNGYPQLDGIWLDEYNPRFEIATTTDTRPTFPNGLALAPTNRNFVNANGDFIYTEVEPAGGYYDQLVSWIRKTYPQLRIIGNAGGDLYSNQHYYAGLVDILVSFEQTLEYARAPSWQKPSVEWSKLDIFQAGDPRDNALGRASIIHSNTTDLRTALDQPLLHGYTHVYTTNLALDSQLVGGWGTGPWGNMPPYLWSEIDYLVNR